MITTLLRSFGTKPVESNSNMIACSRGASDARRACQQVDKENRTSIDIGKLFQNLRYIVHYTTLSVR